MLIVCAALEFFGDDMVCWKSEVRRWIPFCRRYGDSSDTAGCHVRLGNYVCSYQRGQDPLAVAAVHVES